MIRELLHSTGEDPDREGLQETPARFLKAFEFWTSGYRINPASVLKAFKDGGQGYDQMVLQTNIPVWSLCEHHLAPFFGVAHIGYIPAGRVVGLSKLARLTDVFARRLQVQERLTQQIACALADHLQPKGVGVILQCRHTCMESRGVCKAGTITTTSHLVGTMLEEASCRQEFMDLALKAK